jgi:hypothetical protein
LDEDAQQMSMGADNTVAGEPPIIKFPSSNCIYVHPEGLKASSVQTRRFVVSLATAMPQNSQPRAGQSLPRHKLPLLHITQPQLTTSLTFRLQNSQQIVRHNWPPKPDFTAINALAFQNIMKLSFPFRMTNHSEVSKEPPSFQ